MAALVGQAIEFCATFEPGEAVDTPEAQRSFVISSVAIATEGSDGVLDELLADPGDGTMNLRLGADLEEGFINGEFICEAPEPFTLNAAGLPTLQSFRCNAGTVTMRRFAGGNAVTDVGVGSAVFAANVP